MVSHFTLFVALAALALSALGTWAILPVLKRHALDLPNARSNHKEPVPRGGGIAMISAMLICLLACGFPLSIAAAATLLLIISFLDDMGGMPTLVRLAVQFAAVGVALHALPGRMFPGFVPVLLETAFIAVIWVWYINLTNFMDGIDGISAMQAILTCAGICIVTRLHPDLPFSLAQFAAVVAAASYGFYLFNRSPARIFMGDAGSVPLGFLLGFLLLSLARQGYVWAALILPAYYLSDATLTLLKRLRRGEKVWQAHSEHAYQQAVRSGLTHAQVVSRISWLNAALILLAIGASVSMMTGIVCLIAAYVLTLWLIRSFTHDTFRSA